MVKQEVDNRDNEYTENNTQRVYFKIRVGDFHTETECDSREYVICLYDSGSDEGNQALSLMVSIRRS